MFMKKLYEKNPVVTGIVSALIITAIFYLVEWVLWKFTSLTNGVSWHYIDFIIRMSAGFMGLYVLKVIYQDDLKKVFTGKISKQAWICLIPIGVFFILNIAELLCAETFTPENTVPFLICWLTQIGSGFYEEIVSRAVLMSGLLIKHKSSVRGRIYMVTFTGFIFGCFHLMNVIYGNELVTCIWWGLETFVWGMFMAAIYMMTSNLWLLIAIHTIWDIIIRIPEYYIGEVANEVLLEILTIMEEIVSNGILIVIGIWICFWCHKNDMKKQERRGTKNGTEIICHDLY